MLGLFVFFIKKKKVSNLLFFDDIMKFESYIFEFYFLCFYNVIFFGL